MKNRQRGFTGIAILIVVVLLTLAVGMGAVIQKKKDESRVLQNNFQGQNKSSLINPTQAPTLTTSSVRTNLTPQPTKVPDLPMKNLPIPVACTKDADCTYVTSGEICLDPTYKGCLPCLPPLCFEEEPQTVKGQCLNSGCVYSKISPSSLDVSTPKSR